MKLSLLLEILSVLDMARDKANAFEHLTGKEYTRLFGAWSTLKAEINALGIEVPVEHEKEAA
jgi:hypothetical protein